MSNSVIWRRSTLTCDLKSKQNVNRNDFSPRGVKLKLWLKFSWVVTKKHMSFVKEYVVKTLTIIMMQGFDMPSGKAPKLYTVLVLCIVGHGLPLCLTHSYASDHFKRSVVICRSIFDRGVWLACAYRMAQSIILLCNPPLSALRCVYWLCTNLLAFYLRQSLTM